MCALNVYLVCMQRAYKDYENQKWQMDTTSKNFLPKIQRKSIWKGNYKEKSASHQMQLVQAEDKGALRVWRIREKDGAPLCK